MSMGGGGVSAPDIKFQPVGFQTPGLSGAFTPNGAGGGIYQISRSGGLQKNITGLKDTFGQEANAFGGLLNTVRPGFSQFRQAGLANIENARQQNVSNLSDSLAQRRVMGSSFANSALSNANADFAQKSSDFIAQSYLQELQASSQLTQQQFGAQSQKFKVAIDQLNLEGALAADLSSKASQTMASVAETQAQLQTQAAEFNAQLQASEMMGMGSMLGSLMGGFGGKGGSDVLAKENIQRVGTTVHNLPLYQFNYKGKKDCYEGVMAHDVKKVMPDAVYRHIDGRYSVNYDMLGIKMRRVK